MKEDNQPHGAYADIIKNILKHADIEYQIFLALNRRVKKMIIDDSIELVIGPKNTFNNPNYFYFSRDIITKIDLRVFWIGEQSSVSRASDFSK